MRHNRGFTAIDLLVVVGTLLVLSVIVVRQFYPRGCRAASIHCISQLRQIGIAFRMWGNDHGDKFPMEVPFEKGGAREFALAGEPAPLFRSISNELTTPKILWCDKDKERFATRDFRGMTERNLSYFVGIDADEAKPQSILAGERNLTVNGVTAGRGLFTVTNSETLAWSRAMHKEQGNLLLGDGSACQVNNSALRRQVVSSELTGTATRLAMP